MTERKPPGVSFETFADAQIRRAREEGLFDDLPGKGKPLETRDAYDPNWWAKQFLRREGVSMLPPALEIRRTVEREMEKIRELRSEKKVRESVEALNEKIRLLNRSGSWGPPTTQGTLDADSIVARWKEGQAGESQ
jgi:hypothetical protein